MTSKRWGGRKGDLIEGVFRAQVSEAMTPDLRAECWEQCLFGELGSEGFRKVE